MERLTKHCTYGNGNYTVCHNSCEYGYNCATCQRLTRIIDRLAAYEDIDMMPEEIERILDEYGRGMTLRTSNAERLRIIKDVPTEELRKCVEKWRGLHEID